jgi:hypothetical protein
MLDSSKIYKCALNQRNIAVKEFLNNLDENKKRSQLWDLITYMKKYVEILFYNFNIYNSVVSFFVFTPNKSIEVH